MHSIAENISVMQVPAGIVVPPEMRAAHERLLSRFNPENPPQAEHMQAFTDNEHSALFFALLETPPDEQISWHSVAPERYIGTLTLAGLQTTTRYSGYIEHVVVDAQHEGRGIGEMLVRTAIATAQAKGMSRLDLTSGPSKIAAQRLYQKIGFHERTTNNWRYEL